MNDRKWATAAALSAVLACGPVLPAQEQKPASQAQPQKPAAKAQSAPAQPPPTAEEMEQMARWREYATPGVHHRHLDVFVGQWEAEVRWWAGPQSQPQVMQGTMQVRWILDGRFLQFDSVGPAERPDQPPFHGIGLVGYDNVKKQYVSVWLDNMGTGMMIGQGTYDPAAKVFEYAGEYADPMTGRPNQKWRGTTRVESPDRLLDQMFITGPDGKEFKQMEIIYTRVKDSPASRQ